jgi:hypothetical protein
MGANAALSLYWNFLTIQRQANSKKNVECIPEMGSRGNDYRQFRRPYGTRCVFPGVPGVETPGYCQRSLRDLSCPATSNHSAIFCSVGN